MRDLKWLVISISCALLFWPAKGRTAEILNDVTQKWSFSCSNEALTKSGMIGQGAQWANAAEFNELYRDLATRAVSEGLSALKPINPELYRVAIQRAQTGYPIHWICSFVRGAESFNAFFTPRELITTGDFEAIAITPSWVENLKLSLRGDTEKTNEVLATLFHEYLHYLRLDNLIVEAHKGNPFLLPNFWPVQVNSDVIVNCTAQAFPNRNRIVEVREINLQYGVTATHEALSRSRGSCEICARAKALGQEGTIVQDNAFSINEAVKRCASTTEDTISNLVEMRTGGWKILPIK